MTRAQIKADGGLFYVLPSEDEWYKTAYFRLGHFSTGVYTLERSGKIIFRENSAVGTVQLKRT